MTTVKAPTLAASVNRLIRAGAKLPGVLARVEFRRASFAPGFAPKVECAPPPAKAAWCGPERATRLGACVVLCVAACADPRGEGAHHPVAPKAPLEAARASTKTGDCVWQDATSAPQQGVLASGFPDCGEPDAALGRVAE